MRTKTRRIQRAEDPAAIGGHLDAAFGACDLAPRNPPAPAGERQYRGEQFQSDSPANLQAIWICLLPESASPVALRMPTGILRINLLDNTRSDVIEPTIVTQLLGAKE